MFAVLPASMRAESVHPGAPFIASLIHLSLIAAGVVVTRQVTTLSAIARTADNLPVYVDRAPPVPHSLPPSSATAITPAPAVAPTVAVPLQVPIVAPIDMPAIAITGTPTLGTRTTDPGVITGVTRSVGTTPSSMRVLSAREVDEPVQLLRGVTPSYPPAMRAIGRTGLVRLQYVVDTLGAVEQRTIVVLESPDVAFTASASRAVELMHFRPARLGGRAVRQLAEQVIRFAIDR